jgi:hypothetical protein
MPGEPSLAGPNAIEIAGFRYLLVDGTCVVHLAVETPGDPRSKPAVATIEMRASVIADIGYDVTQLGDKRWGPRTLCGYDWRTMAGGETGGLVPYLHPVIVPSCRTCIRLVTRGFPRAEPDDRIELLAQLVADNVGERGYSEVVGTPGEHLDALRAAITTALHRRGHRVRTIAQGERLCVLSQDAWDALTDRERDARTRAALEVIEATTAGKAAHADEPSWRLFWREWEPWGH